METPSNGQGNKWVIVFLIYADFTTSEKLPMIDDMKIMVNSMLGDIITTPINNNQTRMFVILNSIKYVFDDHHTQIENRAAFFTVRCQANGKQNHISECHLVGPDKKGNDTLILQKSDQLAYVLEQTGVQDDEEVFLITWDHGSAFGIFRKQTPTLSKSVVRKEIDQGSFQYPFIELFWKAIKKQDKKTDNFLGRKPIENAFTTIQIGHSLVKMKNSSENIKRLRFFANKENEFIYDDNAGRIRFFNQNNDRGDLMNTKTHSAFSNKKIPILSDGVLKNEIIVEPQAAEILTNRELDEALKKWLNGKKVGVLLMSNCWMMNLHTMYALKDSVRCLVAPQGNIDIPGYNLKDILAEITTSNKTFGPPELAVTCVKTFDNAYSRAKAVMNDRSEPDVLELFKIFAVDLSKTTFDKNTLTLQIDLLKDIINLLIKQFVEFSQRAEKTEMKYFLKYIRAACFDFTGGIVMMVDVVNWIKSINSANQQFDKTLKKLTGVFSPSIAEFESSISDNSIVLDSSSGKDIYSPQDNQADFAVIELPPTGYSIFFPIEDCSLVETSSTYINVKANVLSDQLLKDFPEWRRFLNFIDPKIDKIFINR